jgi:dihydroorotate dehydrogenase (fumarate)
MHSIDLSTEYLGMKLKSPLVASASPLSEDLDNIRQLEDHGASAVVLFSLFEEQVRLEQLELHHHTMSGTESFVESLSNFHEPEDRYRVGPEGYLEHIHKVKKAVGIPVIASLNGSTPGGWIRFARYMEEAGADALELNIYRIPTDLNLSGSEIEQSYLDILKSVKEAVKIPVAIKLSPFFSNMANMAKRLDEAGADGLVLFNRFYQPDIDLKTLEVKSDIILSTSSVMRLPLRWIAILKDRIKADLAASSGINKGADVLKMLMVGANVTMLASTLLKHGIPYLQTIRKNMLEWMEVNEYESVKQMQGSMSQMKTHAPAEFEREQYMKAITHYPFHKH